MGFLDNLAMRKAERSLRPFMRPDERLIEYDIADVPRLGPNTPVILSDRAIYFQQGDQAIRVPYEHIMDLQAKGDRLLAFSTKSGNAWSLAIVGAPKGDLYSTISHYLDKSIRFSQVIAVPGGQVFATNRRIDEDGPWTWLVGRSEGLNLQDHEVRSAVEAEIGAVIERFGDPFPWN